MALSFQNTPQISYFIVKFQRKFNFKKNFLVVCFKLISTLPSLQKSSFLKLSFLWNFFLKSNIQGVFWKKKSSASCIFYQKYIFMCLKDFKLQPKTPTTFKKMFGIQVPRLFLPSSISKPQEQNVVHLLWVFIYWYI